MRSTYSIARQEELDLTEILYFVGLVLYMLLYLSYETRWMYPGIVMTLLKPTAMLCLIASMVSSLSKFKSAKEFFLFFGVFLISLIVGINAGFQKNLNLLTETTITLCLVFGAKGIDYKKIIKVYLIVGGTYSMVTVCASLLGIIENMSDISNKTDDFLMPISSSHRLSFGYNWATNMANHVFFIVLYYFVYINRSFKIVEYLAFIVISFLLIYYTGSRLSAFLIIILLLLSLLIKPEKVRKMFNGRVAAIIFIISIPLFTLVSYLITAFYDSSDILWFAVDAFMSGRLRLCNEALTSAGIPFLGQFYRMYSSVRNDGEFYNYVDSTYIQLLVIYGLIYTFLFISAYVYIIIKASRRKDTILMITIFLAGISGIIAQHFLEPYMSPFMIALFARHRRGIDFVSRIHGRIS